MGFYLVQAGSTLVRVNTDGTSAAFTLPTGITIEPTKRLRAAVLNANVILFGSPTRNLWLDRYGSLHELSVTPPSARPELTPASGGLLNGAYRARYTYLVRDPFTNDVLAESDYSPVSGESAALTDDALLVTKILPSERPDVWGKRFYRTASGPGDEYFKWLDIESNSRTVTSFQDARSDDSIGTLEGPTDLGTPPARFELAVEWKDRIWAKSTEDIDSCRFSSNRKHYAWPATNEFGIKPIGNDPFGINGFLPRRDELGIARRDIIYKLIGDPPNVDLIKLVEGTGVEASDSVCVIRDVAYWLAEDGVYSWGPDGVRCLSDGKVRNWFVSDTYFNRARFRYAFGRYNKRIHAYELHLAAAGSSSEDRFVTYYINEGIWLGPHRTAEFTPSVSGVVRDGSGLELPLIGDTAGFLWKVNQSTQSDGASAIDFDVQLRHNCKIPDIDKVFLQMSVMTEVEAAGTLTITPALGGISASDQSNIAHALTTGRQRLRHISTQSQGVGRFLKLRFRNNETAQDVALHGYEIPWHEAGRR